MRIYIKQRGRKYYVHEGKDEPPILNGYWESKRKTGLHATGEIELAENCYDQMVKIHGNAPCGVHLAFLCGAMGNIDLAFDYLEEAYESRQPWVPIVQCWTSSDPLHTDPRFEPFVRKVGILPPGMK